jgi:hypothetical protein
MAWTSGNIIVASRLIDIPARNLIDGGIIVGFNLLKIYSTNIFTETLAGTGNVVESRANGTLQLTCPADNDDVKSYETSKIALSLLPRIVILKINSITVNGASTYVAIGLSDGVVTHLTGLYTENGGTSWSFITSTGTGTLTAIDAPVAGDVFIIYATFSRCSLFKNGSHLATHTTNIPTAALGRSMHIITAAGQGAGSQVTLGFMS